MLKMNRLQRHFGTAINISRHSNFKVLNDTDLSFFERILKKSQVITNTDDLAINNQDWTKKF